jgi:hypothetical protein
MSFMTKSQKSKVSQEISENVSRHSHILCRTPSKSNQRYLWSEFAHLPMSTHVPILTMYVHPLSSQALCTKLVPSELIGYSSELTDRNTHLTDE